MTEDEALAAALALSSSASAAPSVDALADRVLPGVDWAHFKTFSHPLFDGLVNYGTNLVALLAGVCLLAVGLATGLACCMFEGSCGVKDPNALLQGFYVGLALPPLCCFYPVKYAACVVLTLVVGILYVPFWLLGGTRVSIAPPEL